jgi:hypothetical protein
MKRKIIISNPDLLELREKLTDAIQDYLKSCDMMVGTGRPFGKLVKVKGDVSIWIHHTDKMVMVEKLQKKSYENSKN